VIRATDMRRLQVSILQCDLSLSDRPHFGTYLRTKQSNPAEIERATVWGRPGRGNTVA
jgi:hypothetical protein